MTDLEQLLAALRRRPVPNRLDQLEPAVWSAIADARAGAQALWSWRAAAAGAALGLGMLASGLAAGARADHELTPFSLHASYAPSTLLSDDL